MMEIDYAWTSAVALEPCSHLCMCLYASACLRVCAYHIFSLHMPKATPEGEKEDRWKKGGEVVGGLKAH